MTAAVRPAADEALPHVRFSDARALVVEEPPGPRPLFRETSWRDLRISTITAPDTTGTQKRGAGP